eukprot:scaffold241_cov229-Prasinococcus_capsulatus_cf.AAC.3
MLCSLSRGAAALLRRWPCSRSKRSMSATTSPGTMMSPAPRMLKGYLDSTSTPAATPSPCSETQSRRPRRLHRLVPTAASLRTCGDREDQPCGAGEGLGRGDGEHDVLAEDAASTPHGLPPLSSRASPQHRRALPHACKRRAPLAGEHPEYVVEEQADEQLAGSP